MTFLHDSLVLVALRGTYVFLIPGVTTPGWTSSKQCPWLWPFYADGSVSGLGFLSDRANKILRHFGSVYV